VSKLKLDMGFNDVLWTLSEGNPGAINVIMESMKHGEEIDPENHFKGWGFALHLDALGIYGGRVWMLYKDVCRENLAHAIGMVRSVQLGIIPIEELNQAIDGKGKIDVDAMMEKVREELPRFNSEYHCTL
jgi:hypothetical protein